MTSRARARREAPEGTAPEASRRDVRRSDATQERAGTVKERTDAAQERADAAQERADAAREPALLVDLDRDLLRTNLLHEAVTGCLLSRPLIALRAIGASRLARTDLGSAIAGETEIDLATVPYDPDTLQLLLRERARGRRLLLMADRTRAWAAPVAAHFGIFDEVLSGPQAIPAAAGPSADGVAAGASAPAPAPERLRHRPRRPPAPLAVLRAMRPHQWLKNLLVFVALFTAQKLEDRNMDLHALEMFAAFCLISSSVYLLNDMADLPADRRHVTKRTRPFASGELGVLSGWLLWPLLLALGVTLAVLALPIGAALWLLAYYAGTVAYTFGAKREAILDVIVLAGLYTVRIIAGAAAISVPTSIWLLTFSMSIFTSLALVKRVSELTRVIEDRGTIRGRGYQPRDLGTLKSLGVTASYAAVVVLALYVHDPGTSRLYRNPSILWLVVPLMLYWSSRLWLLADRGEIDEDPVLFALKDRVSYLVLITTAAAFTAAKFLG